MATMKLHGTGDPAYRGIEPAPQAPPLNKTISMDYDDTFDLNPSGMLSVCMAMRMAGFRVIGVTLRNRAQPITCKFFHSAVESIIYCGGKEKRQAVQDFGIKIDVWMDDKPEFIVNTYENIFGYKHEDAVAMEPYCEPLMCLPWEVPTLEGAVPMEREETKGPFGAPVPGFLKRQ